MLTRTTGSRLSYALHCLRLFPLGKTRNRVLSNYPCRFNSTASVELPDQGKLPSKEPGSKFVIPTAEFDWHYLCDPKNLKSIKDNIDLRKGVGDIDKLQQLWSSFKEGNSNVTWEDLKKEAYDIPNNTHPDVPLGGEEKNEILQIKGTRKEFDFPVKSALELGEYLDQIRMSNLGVTTAHKSYYFLGDLAQMEQALIKYTIDKLIGKGFLLLSVPDIIHSPVIEGCGFKTTGKATQVYRLIEKQGGLCLSGTGEISTGGYFINKILNAEELPKRICTSSRCYRAETSNDEGIYRVHQFNKVEMFSLVANESGNESEEMMEEIRQIQTELFTDLGLHFRVLNMSSQELGAPAFRKYDMEAWMPAEGIWGEISSTSNCTDYQSRRLNIRYRKNGTGEAKHVHTLNGTACAVPRMMIAILENNQKPDGEINVPDALQPYMDGKKLIKKNKTLTKKWIRNTKLFDHSLY